MAAGLLARNAVQTGLKTKPWVKTSLAPGSKVVTDYLDEAGLTALPGAARLLPRRLRLHHLHRQLRPAAGGGRRRHRRRRPRRRVGALRQPQLRGPHPLAGPRQLPGLAAAGRRLRARRHDGHRLRQRAARHRQRRPARLPARHLALAHGDRRGDAHRPPVGDVPLASTRTSSPATTPGATSTCPTGDLFAWDPFSTYVRKPPYFDGMTMDAGAASDIHGARVLGVFGDSVTTDHISPAGEIVAQQPGRPLPDRATTCRSPSTTPTAPGAATTRSWAAAPSPTSASRTAGPRRRGLVHAPPAGRRGDVDLRRRA